jgi:hypothetical protein
MVGLNVSVEAVSPAPVPKTPTPSTAPPTTPGASQAPNMPSAELQKRRAALAALLEAREAPQLPAGTVQTGEFGLSNEPLRFYFSIYVTDKNLEPVSGLPSCG